LPVEETDPARHLPLGSARGVHAAALLTGLMGLVNVFSAVTPAASDRLRLIEDFSPLQVRQGGHLTSALAGFALLLLAGALWRRKRVAWLATVCVLAASVVAHLVKGLDFEEAGLALLLCGLLWIMRAQFHARSDLPSVRQAFVTLIVALLFTISYGTLGFFLLDRHFGTSFGLSDAVRQTVVMFTEYYDPGLEPVTRFGRYFAGSIYTVGMVTTSYALLLLIRPVLSSRRASEADRARAETIAAGNGRTSLVAFTLLDDKLYFFSPGDSYVAYVVKGRAAVVLGDPVGPKGDARETIERFVHLCSVNDWFPVFYQVLPDYLVHYRRVGLRSLQIGLEAILNLHTWALEGGQRKSIRTAVNRMQREGYCADVRLPPHAPELIAELRAVSDDWLANRGGSEMRFSVGWFDAAYLNRSRLLVLRDPTGIVSAFANVVENSQSSQVAVDLMRHRTAADKGQMDFVFATLLGWAKQAGFSRFSFGLSGLAGLGTSPRDPAMERALGFVFNHINNFYNFKGLHAYKAKFGPSWEPRYLIYPSLASLPAMGAALIRANTGDDVLGGYLFHPN
jgi:phosphatidylglycerol lysyltransferase